MADISDNNLAHLRDLVASGGKGSVPALVYAKLRDLGYVMKVEGETAGRGKTVVHVTASGSKAAE